MIFRRSIFLIPLCCIAACAQEGSLDPEFKKIPFQQWFDKAGQSRLKWIVRITHPELSVHQRLMTEVHVQVDGAELARRRGKGQFVTFVQLTDEQGRVFQNHTAIDLEKLDEKIEAQDVDCTMPAFVLPGTYRVAVAIYDSASREHSTREMSLHVSPLKADPIPDMWRGLPAVEFSTEEGPPDSWYLPATTSRLNLRLDTHNPVRVDVIVNVTPSEQRTRSTNTQNHNLTALIPSLKALSQLDAGSGSLNVELLDLSRRQVIFKQKNVHSLEWPEVRSALSEKSAGIIDIKSLEDRRHNAEFFEKQVAGKLTGSESPRALIILSAPMAFEEGTILDPISTTAPAGSRVFYIRYRVPQPPVHRELPEYARAGMRRGGLARGPGLQPPAAREPRIDQLAPTLKPLGLKLFDVDTPDQFRKALASIMDEISKM